MLAEQRAKEKEDLIVSLEQRKVALQQHEQLMATRKLVRQIKKAYKTQMKLEQKKRSIQRYYNEAE